MPPYDERAPIGKEENQRFYDLVTKEFRQAAFDGQLPIWAKRSNSNLWEEVPAEYWKDHRISYLNVVREDPTKLSVEVEKAGSFKRSNEWHEFMTTRMAVNAIWPLAALETTLAELKQPPLEYAAIKHIDRMTLREAAFYWCDLPVGRGWMPSNVESWYNALAAAVTKGELKFEAKYSGYEYGHGEREYEHQKSRPHLHTEVTRKALQAFAKRHGYDPKFLRDA